MQKITPHLWFDKNVKEAVEFYTSVFPDSVITDISTIRDTPSGDCDIVSFTILGQKLMAIGAGPEFTFNPSLSFMVNFDPSQDPDARARIDQVWEKLLEGGKALMPLDAYPFSERYGWVEDKYGLSWQLILTNPEGEERPRLIPALMFTGENTGKAEEASDFYLSVFKDGKRGAIAKYPAGSETDKEGTVMFTDFRLGDLWFAAMDSGYAHGFVFNESMSFMVACSDQAEIDYYWEKLSAVPEAEQCGWLKDAFGVSWQIVPKDLDELMGKGTEEQRARVTQAFLGMKKFDIAVLERAAKGE